MALVVCVVCLFEKDGLEAIELIDVVRVKTFTVDVDFVERELLRLEHLLGLGQLIHACFAFLTTAAVL